MSTRVVTWRRHKCAKAHRDYQTFIKCAIGARRLLWANGSGPYATISWCGRWNEVTVTMHANLPKALTALKQMNRLSCGGRCIGSHELVEVVL